MKVIFITKSLNRSFLKKSQQQILVEILSISGEFGGVSMENIGFVVNIIFYDVNYHQG